MRIDPNVLVAPENRYLELPEAPSLREAFARLLAPGLNGQLWWHLVVARSDGTWALARFDRLYTRASADPAILDVALRDVDVLIPATAVEQEGTSTAAAYELAHSAPNLAIVVTREGKLDGILAIAQLASAAWSREQLRDLVAPDPAGVPGPRAAPRPETVRRFTDVSCPSRIDLQTPGFSVVVRLKVELPADSRATSIDLSLEIPVQVELRAPGFRVLNKPVQKITILEGRDSDPISFELRPTEPGRHELQLDFFQGSDHLTTVNLPIEVVDLADSASRPTTAKRYRLADRAGTLPPDRTLRISCRRTAVKTILGFTLRQGSSRREDFAEVEIQSDLADYTTLLFDRLTRLTEEASQSSPAPQVIQREVERVLRVKGQRLWELLPAGLRDLYADERETWHGTALQIVSEEPHIPWELLWPWGEGWEDDGPWCLSLRLSRWLSSGNQGGAPSRLPIDSLACLVPQDSGLPATVPEQELLEDLAKQYRIVDLSPHVATPDSLIKLLSEGNCSWVHIATHGRFSVAAPEQMSVLSLEGTAEQMSVLSLGGTVGLAPEDIGGPWISAHLKERRPAFVLNACHSGKLTWHLTGLGGWAGRLIGLGAGMFLGTLWAVDDTSASTLMQIFYRLLLEEGVPIGEALRQARQSARRAGDPTWLAYSLYGHPNARCVPSDLRYVSRTREKARDDSPLDEVARQTRNEKAVVIAGMLLERLKKSGGQPLRLDDGLAVAEGVGGDPKDALLAIERLTQAGALRRVFLDLQQDPARPMSWDEVLRRLGGREALGGEEWRGGARTMAVHWVPSDRRRS